MSRMRILCIAVAIVAGTLLAAAQGPRFYPDDPLPREPRPLPVSEPQRRALSALLETINSNLRTRGQRHPANGVLEAQGVNTLGEVMDGDWYVNRHGTRRMTVAELQRGPGHDRPPDLTATWRVLVVKPFGVNPGLLVADGKRDLYILRFDPIGSEGLATGAQMVTSQFFYALGYHVAENYIVRFDRARLVVDETGQAVSSAGHTRALAADDIDRFLKGAPEGKGRTYRAVATRLPEVRGALLGPYQMWGTRSDDPNDTVLHEHRRDLRGMFVFAAWLNVSNMRAVSTQDILATVDGVPRIRHYVVDLTKSLGSSMFSGPKMAWEGHETVLPPAREVGKSVGSLGLATPEWMRENHSDLPEVGAFGSSAFDPETWTPADPLPPFVNRLPDDTFWAARQVMAFTDEDIRAIVQVGQYSKPAEDWITATLIERRNRIGRAYFARVLPLDHIRLEGNTLAFDDVGVSNGFAQPRTCTTTWYTFDNAKGVLLETIGTGAEVPAEARAIADGSYVAARIHAGAQAMNVTVFLRRHAGAFQVVGIDRSWPRKNVVSLPPPPRADRRAYADLMPRQQELFQTYVDHYNATRGSHYSAEEQFERLTVSEQTTFYAITHALLHTSLSDSSGAALGLAIDQVAAVNRIAGQYDGLGGDQQFRIFVTLKPGTRELLDKSREFFRDHENTVYHIGFPHSYRQAGKEPNMQMSVSDDGLRADIDVDYRSSRSPQALFNGHLTASNSDVRAGDNPKLHNGRWSGLIFWWQDKFGKLQASLARPVDLANTDRAMGPATPLPPDRPSGASPDKIEDAVQEFLTDWLVRRQYDQALEFLSPQAFACLTLGDDGKSQALDAAGARREARRLMEYANARLGPRTDLTSAIVAFTPRNPDRPVTDHPFKREFLLGPVPEAEARQYLCNQAAAPGAGTGTDYYAVIFTFRVDGGGTLGMLWNREGGRWKLVSYQPLVP
jgi:hypothetical protein